MSDEFLLNANQTRVAPSSAAVRYHHQELAWAEVAKKVKNRGIDV